MREAVRFTGFLVLRGFSWVPNLRAFLLRTLIELTGPQDKQALGAGSPNLLSSNRNPPEDLRSVVTSIPGLYIGRLQNASKNGVSHVFQSRGNIVSDS